MAKTGPLDPAGGFREVIVPVTDPGGLNDLVLIASSASPQKGSVLDLNWVQFNKATPTKPPASQP